MDNDFTVNASQPFPNIFNDTFQVYIYLDQCCINTRETQSRKPGD